MLNIIVMNLEVCEAASSRVPMASPRRARTFHLAIEYLLVSVLFCNTDVKPAALLLIYTRYPSGIRLYYICLKAECGRNEEGFLYI